MSITKFYLRVHRVEQHCLFDLSWGQEQRLSVAQLAFPETLADAYQTWRTAYLHHYETLPVNSEPEPYTNLRGQLVSKGSVKPVINSHSALIKAQERLLLAFHHWLRQPELYEIRSTVAKSSRTADQQPIQLFLTCDPIDLARLPWETWEIGAEDVLTHPIHILRMPASIRATANRLVLHHRPRILVILGDDRQLNLKVDQDIMASLRTVAEMQFIRRNPDESIPDLKQRIVQAITDETGWDMLFFAGHSSETELTGGELEIAARASIQISEITAQLKVAQQRGLRVAVFNSCEGLSFANSLIDLGLDQVVVMRERVHNAVAQEFLLHFCQRLVQHQTVYEATIAACQFLKTEKSLTYPSGYLLPSLFCRPEADPFRILPKSWITWLQRFKPKRYEAIAVAGLAVLSWLLPVQQELLDQRIMIQARLRSSEATAQQPTVPPVLLIRVDDESINAAIREAGVSVRNPIPQGYMSKLINRLSVLNAKLIGVDYLLDNLQGAATSELRQTIDRASQQGTRFVFVMTPSSNAGDVWLKTLPEIADPKTSIHADALRSMGEIYFIPLLWQPEQPLFFSYWLAWFHRHCIEQNSTICQTQDPQLLAAQARQEADTQIPRSNRSDITAFAHWLGQQWFHPISDFSLPPQQIYQTISAQTFLQLSADAPELKHIAQQTVMIVPAYPETGIPIGSELFRPPGAVRYWYGQEDLENINRDMISGEHHAYLFDHFLNRRLVVPVPDLWMVLLAALAGKLTVLLIGSRSAQNTLSSRFAKLGLQRWYSLVLFAGGTLVYTVLSLGLYALPAAILLPITFPVATFWVYILPVVKKEIFHA